ncbi:MAG: amidophosphoribosyltransferase [Pseudomonadales bacterium]|nr:amidophosphoribosyltransferase [Pseudomonadales bacterium]
MCGVVGLVSHSGVNQQIYDALLALQHRGQDSAGIVTWDDDARLNLRKGNGLVRDVFEERHMRRLRGTMGIGHVRYPTAGTSSAAEAQPMYVNAPYGLSLAHNGNLTNSRRLEADVFRAGLRHVNTSSDSEVLLNVFAHELQKIGAHEPTAEHVFAAVAGVHRRCRGAYAVVVIINGRGVVAFRDPHGIRPLGFGVKRTSAGQEVMVASESNAIDILGFDFQRDVLPGEAIYIEPNGEYTTKRCAPPAVATPCIFELVYLAREDSIMDEISVYKARLRMGEKLAKRIQERYPDGNHDIDVVVPIPESSRTSAIPLAYALGVKFREGFVKNRYIGRTFIMPGQTQRTKSVQQKLNAIELEFQGKNVLLVEDSIVRGTTTGEIVRQARRAGARKVFMAVAAPPVRYPNVYGIDMPAAREFVAYGREPEEVAETIGVDWLVYQSLDDLVAAAAEGNPNLKRFDCSVFDGKYITGDIDGDYLEHLSRLRSDEVKQHREAEQGERFADATVIELHNHA